MPNFESHFSKDKQEVTTVEHESGERITEQYEGRLTLIKAMTLIEDQRNKIRKLLNRPQHR